MPKRKTGKTKGIGPKLDPALVTTLVEAGNWDELERLAGINPQSVEEAIRKGPYLTQEEVRRRLDDAPKKTQPARKPVRRG